MSEKVALVTGAAGTIGEGLVRRFAADGWGVALVDRDERGAALAEAVGGLFVRADVGDEEEVRGAVAATLERFGGLDALICNAAMTDIAMGPLHQVSYADWRAQLRVNLDGPFLCAKHACRALAERKGSIVHISSTRAFMSEADTFAYSASKGALQALTHAMAISLGPEVRVNAIAPGWIHGGDASELSAEDHTQHPTGRVGRPEDIAGAVAYLVGPDSGFVTGATLVVDGGMTRKMIYAE